MRFFLCLEYIHRLNWEAKMFFVVFFLAAQVHRVVPRTWIYDISKHVEKFINNGLNRNQKFSVFYTDSNDAFDENDIPKLNFVPDFTANDRNARQNIFPNHGVYECNLQSFRCKFLSLL